MRQRIHTDVFLRIAVTRMCGVAERFDEAEEMSVVLWHMFKPWRREENYTIEGNEVAVQFAADDQEEIGQYGVTIRYTKPDAGSETGKRRFAVDMPNAFELAPATADCGCAKEIQLCGHVQIAADGINVETPTIGEDGNWVINGQNTGKPSRGEDGKPGSLAYPTFDVDPRTGILTMRAPFFYDGSEFEIKDGNLMMRI